MYGHALIVVLAYVIAQQLVKNREQGGKLVIKSRDHTSPSPLLVATSRFLCEVDFKDLQTIGL